MIKFLAIKPTHCISDFLYGELVRRILCWSWLVSKLDISISVNCTQVSIKYSKIITPVLITIGIGIIFHLSGLFELNNHLWVSLILSWFIRLLYIVFWNRLSLMNMAIFFTQFLVSSAIGFWIYTKLIRWPNLVASIQRQYD